MKCPKCMETVNETHLFCWNCGVNLAKARADRFALYKNNQKQDFLSWCEKKTGTKFCKGILGKAAWMIATNSEDKREFLDGEKMGTTESYAGIDPDKDYLLDPQQRDAFTIRCDWCGHDIYSGEHFSRVPAPLWAREKTGKDEIMFCSDCLHEIMDNIATLEVIRYGA